MNDIEKDMVIVMIDIRIGKRIKQCRERLGLTQEQFAEKTGFTANYISTLERGASFPRCENLITLLNALEVPADAIFCDVVTHSTKYKANQLSEELEALSPEAQKRRKALRSFLFFCHASTLFFIFLCYTMDKRLRDALKYVVSEI